MFRFCFLLNNRLKTGSNVTTQYSQYQLNPTDSHVLTVDQGKTSTNCVNFIGPFDKWNDSLKYKS